MFGYAGVSPVRETTDFTVVHPEHVRRVYEGEEFQMAVHYLEIVSNDAETLTGLYERLHGFSFGPPDPDLGQARVAPQGDGALVGIRKPLAAHEEPIMRTY